MNKINHNEEGSMKMNNAPKEINFKNIFIFTVIVLLIIGGGYFIIRNITKPTEKITYSFLDNFDEAIDYTKWENGKAGNPVSSSSSTFNGKLVLTMTGDSSDLPTESVWIVSKESLPYYPRIFEVSTEVDTNEGVESAFYIAPEKSMNIDPWNQEYWVKFYVIDGYIAIAKKVKGVEKDLGGIINPSLEVKWKIEFLSPNEVIVKVDTGDGFIPIFSTTELGMNFDSAYFYLLQAQNLDEEHTTNYDYFMVKSV